MNKMLMLCVFFFYFLFQLKYFNDPVVNILQHLDVIEYRDPVQRLEIFTSLAQVIPSIPKVSHIQTKSNNTYKIVSR